MKIKYRYLENPNSDSGYNVYGLAYTGYNPYSGSKCPEYAMFINLKMHRDVPLSRGLEGLTEEDIPEYLRKFDVSWQEIHEIEVPDDIDDNDDFEGWEIDDLLRDRLDYWLTPREKNDRQVA